MKLNSKFLLATLRWRGFKNSPHELATLLSRIPEEMSLHEYQTVLETHLLMPKVVSAMWFATCVKEYDWLASHEARIVTYFDSNFPEFFKRLEDPPLILTWWGEIEKPHSDFISVVGSRHPSRDSLNWMDAHFDLFLRNCDATVVSGGAIGIDQKAHSLALRNGRPTICVVPSGLSRMYPAMLAKWKPMILEAGGAIATPFSPFSEMEKRFFVERNRYIACWSKLTFVVESKRRSGTAMTARNAILLQHNLAVLPCSPNHSGLGGLDMIINDGAILIRDQYDLLQAFNSARVKSLPAFEVNEFRPEEKEY